LGWLEGGDYGQIEAISNDGTVVVGTSRSASGVQAFRWTVNDGMVGLGCLPGLESSAGYGVSGNGAVIVGTSYTLGSSLNNAFLWTATGGIVPLGGVDSTAKGVSNNGSVIVGYTRTSAWEAFRWTEEQGMIGIGFLPGNYHESFALATSGDGSVIVGEASNANRYLEAFRWTADGGMVGLGDLEGGIFYSYASDVSDDGSVVVGSSSFSLESEAFRWTPDEGMIGLGYLPGGSFSGASAVSGDGSIIVGGSNDKAFLWTSDDGMVCIQELLENRYNLNLDGWTLYDAIDISNDGRTIVGIGLNPYGNWEGWIATIPEPSTLLLFGIGAMLLRKRR